MRDQIANICWIIEKAKEFQKSICFCFIDHTKAFDCVDHNKLWKILQEIGISDHLTCLLRNLCAGQEATVGNGNETVITMNKASGGDGILAELFQILKDDTVRLLHPICLQIWKS